LKGIVRGLMGINSRIRGIEDAGLHVRHITTSGELKDLNGYGDISFNRPTEPDGVSKSTYSHDIGKPQIRAKIKSLVSFDFRGLSPVTKGLVYAVRSFGFDNPARVAWNAIPYSFVLDWMYPVGSLLDRLSLTQGIIPATVRSTTSHVKMTREYSQYHSSWISPTSDVFVLDNFRNALQVDMVYRRWVGIPTDQTFQVPSIGEQWLIALLAKQKFPKGGLSAFPRLKIEDRLRNPVRI
jgi:hypothetical protein